MSFINAKYSRSMVSVSDEWVNPSHKDVETDPEDGSLILHLGNEIFISDKPDEKIKRNNNELISLEPGHISLFLSKEVLNIHSNEMGLFSIRTPLKLKGIVNISGFHISPSFRGKMVMSLINMNANPVLLRVGENIGKVWFLDFPSKKPDNHASNQNNKKFGAEKIHNNMIDAHLINSIIGKYAHPSDLNNRINNLESKMSIIVGVLSVIVGLITFTLSEFFMRQ